MMDAFFVVLCYELCASTTDSWLCKWCGEGIGFYGDTLAALSSENPLDPCMHGMVEHYCTFN